MDKDEIIKLIKSRRNPKIENKLDIWKLLSDSYAGGNIYQQGNYLHQYYRENDLAYRARKERCIYFNHVQPLDDILTGLIFSQEVERDYPTQLSYIVLHPIVKTDFSIPLSGISSAC